MSREQYRVVSSITRQIGTRNIKLNNADEVAHITRFAEHQHRVPSSRAHASLWPAQMPTLFVCYQCRCWCCLRHFLVDALSVGISWYASYVLEIQPVNVMINRNPEPIITYSDRVAHEGKKQVQRESHAKPVDGAALAPRLWFSSTRGSTSA